MTAKDADKNKRITLRLPVELLREVERQYPARDYRSRSAAIRDAIRTWVALPQPLSEATVVDVEQKQDEYNWQAAPVIEDFPAEQTDGYVTVTPSDFKHIDGGAFRYRHDPAVVIDVSEPESGMPIRKSLRAQLAYHELEATDLNNFQYQLRCRADLVD